MKKTVRSVIYSLGLFVCAHALAQQPVEWPAITQQCKPWTRWWWMGSAVDAPNLTYNMELYQKAGLGGLEITPIYGVKGTEGQFLPYLSPQWTAMFQHTLNEAKRLGLGIDLANASGWPFGGPWVTADDACRTIECKTWQLQGGQKLTEPVQFEQQPFLRLAGPEKPKWTDLREPISQTPDLQKWALDQVKFRKDLPLVTLMAYSAAGEKIDLTSQVDANGQLNWTAPFGDWTLYALFAGWHGKMVERAGPGGEGNVIDHFSKTATENYLAHFDRAFEKVDTKYLRAYFNDSYEVDDARGEADFTPLLFDEFQKRRGYDLRLYLPALFGIASPDSVGRVRCDFRETVSDLLIENYTQAWHQWATGQGKLIRNQAHGSPASLLDLYANTDIPEIEGTELTRIKFASSSANVAGKQLVSSESCTWLNEHFKSTPAQMKKALDVLMLGGVNHIFYHGTAYSPKEAAWPGWLFYAAVHFNPNNSYWSHLAELNAYVAHCQSFLQQGNALNDVLLYFPIYDSWSEPGDAFLKHFDGFKRQPEKWSVKLIAEEMVDKGIAFDYISDRQILGLRVADSRLLTGNCSYKTIVVPSARVMPGATIRKLVELAHQGAMVVFVGDLPVSLPGLGDLSQKQDEYKYSLQDLFFEPMAADSTQTAHLGEGLVMKGRNAMQLLRKSGVAQEPMYQLGLKCTRRIINGRTLYFIAKQSGRAFDGEVTLSQNFEHGALFNPMTGVAGSVPVTSSASGTALRLQLKPEESVILLGDQKAFGGTGYPFYKQQEGTIPVQGNWQVSYVDGGPSKPETLTIQSLKPWNSWTNIDLTNFSGTLCYAISFNKPQPDATAWRLSLGSVKSSAIVYLNGQKLGAVFGPDFSIDIPSDRLLPINTLQIHVSNGMGNRIAWMDKTDQPWRIFYNTNFQTRVPANRGADGNFTAAKWLPEDSGLLGPVSLIPLEVR